MGTKREGVRVTAHRRVAERRVSRDLQWRVWERAAAAARRAPAQHRRFTRSSLLGTLGLAGARSEAMWAGLHANLGADASALKGMRAHWGLD